MSQLFAPGGQIIGASVSASVLPMNIQDLFPLELTLGLRIHHVKCRAGLEYSEYIMRNDGLEEAQAGIKIAGKNINNLRYGDDTTLMAESEEELKSLLMKVKGRVKMLA